MMPVEKEDTKAPLSVVKKAVTANRGVKVIRMDAPELLQQVLKMEEAKLLPPLDHFNTSYFKGRDNDPL